MQVSNLAEPKFTWYSTPDGFISRPLEGIADIMKRFHNIILLPGRWAWSDNMACHSLLLQIGGDTLKLLTNCDAVATTAGPAGPLLTELGICNLNSDSPVATFAFDVGHPEFNSTVRLQYVEEAHKSPCLRMLMADRLLFMVERCFARSARDVWLLLKVGHNKLM